MIRINKHQINCRSYFTTATCIFGSCIEAFKPWLQCPTPSCNITTILISDLQKSRQEEKHVTIKDVHTHFVYSLTLLFVASPWPTDTDTFSVRLAGLILCSSLWPSLSSEASSRVLLVLPWSPVRSSLNCTVYW